MADDDVNDDDDGQDDGAESLIDQIRSVVNEILDERGVVRSDDDDDDAGADGSTMTAKQLEAVVRREMKKAVEQLAQKQKARPRPAPKPKSTPDPVVQPEPSRPSVRDWARKVVLGE